MNLGLNMYLVIIFKSAHENVVLLASRHCSDSPMHHTIWPTGVAARMKVHEDFCCFTFQSTIFQSCWEDFPSSWVEPVLSSG